MLSVTLSKGFPDIANKQPTPGGESSAGSPVRRKTMVAGTVVDDPDQAVRKALVDLRSLLICISMLQRINSVSLCPFPLLCSRD